MEVTFSPQQSHISVSLSTIATPSRKVSHSEAAVDHGTKSCHMSVEARYQCGLPNHWSLVQSRTLYSTCVCVRDVCSAIVDLLAIRYIMVQSGQSLQAVVDGFQSKWGFPQCVGAIAGSHIPIIAPKENPVDYFNSVILQVDHEYMFLDIYVGWPCSVHDA